MKGRIVGHIIYVLTSRVPAIPLNLHLPSTYWKVKPSPLDLTSLIRGFHPHRIQAATGHSNLSILSYHPAGPSSATKQASGTTY